MQRGYVKLWRKMLDHPFYNEKRPMTNREAWETIILTVNHKSNQVLIGQAIYDCNPGESLRSYQSWADIFRWSRSKVVRFFTLLKNMGQIETRNEHSTIRITVLNWDTYQGQPEHEPERKPKPKRNANGIRSESDRTQSKNDKNDKNEKNNIYENFTHYDFKDFHEAYKDFSDMRKKIKKPLTERAIKMLFNKLDSLSNKNKELAIEILNQSTFLDYQDVYAIKGNGATKYGTTTRINPTNKYDGVGGGR